MALSGSFSKTISGSLAYKVEWSATQDVASNTSTITCRHYLTGTGYALNIASKSGTCTVDEASKSFTASAISGSVTSVLLGTTTHTVTHNADGSKSAAIKGVFNIQATLSGTYISSVTASGTATLDTIPRAASITAASSFTDEENPSITYSNPAGNAVSKLEACISFTGSVDDIAYRDVPINGSGYIFTLTDAEREKLRKACTTANSMTVYFFLATTLGGTVHRKSVARTLTIANAQPTLLPTVKDVDGGAVQLTGSSAKMVRHCSDAAYTIGAAAKKHATITSQRVICGGKSATEASGTLENVESGTFMFQATDSRGNTATQTVTLPLVEYVHVTCAMEVSTPTTDGECTLRAFGNAFSGSFGAVANALIVEYRVSTDGGSTWGGWTALAAVQNGSSYDAVANITGLDYQTAYTFQARARDELEVATSDPKTVKAFPLFDWGENDFSFNVPVSADEGITIKGFNVMLRQVIDGYSGLISSESDAVTFLRTPQQGLIPYEDGGSGSLGTAGWPFLAVHANAVYSHGAELGANKLLWGPEAYHMNGQQVIYLTEAVSAQANGIVLAWSAYDGTTVYDYDWHYQYIPKHHITRHGGAGVITNMATAGFGKVGAKYVYVSDTYIQGNDKNNASGTSNGIAYANGYWVLRYVIGV